MQHTPDFFLRFARVLNFPSLGRVETFTPDDIVGFNLDNGFIRVQCKDGSELIVPASDVDRIRWPVIPLEPSIPAVQVSESPAKASPANPSPPPRKEEAASKRKQAKSK